MRRSLLGSLLAAGLLLAPAALLPAQRPSIAGGLSAPMSDLGDAADLGYVLAVGLNTGDTDRPLAARLEGAIDDFGLKRVNQDVRVLSATANAIVNLTPGASSPYLIGGLGLYNTKFGDAASDNDLGVNLGGGLRLPMGSLRGFFEARYHAVLGNRGAGTHIQFVPVTFGILF
jgi:hypothetical protein